MNEWMNEWMNECALERSHIFFFFFQIAHLIAFSVSHAFQPSCQEWREEVKSLHPQYYAVLFQYPKYGGLNFKGGLSLKLRPQKFLVWFKKEIGDKDYLYLAT
jgi:hypothetical protein